VEEVDVDGGDGSGREKLWFFFFRLSWVCPLV